jgi:hypothetical protein
MVPTAAERANGKIEIDDMQSMPKSRFGRNKSGVSVQDSPLSDKNSDKEWEMQRVKATPKVPYTPRTLAFNTLDRQLPLRAAAEGRWS